MKILCAALLFSTVACSRTEPNQAMPVKTLASMASAPAENVSYNDVALEAEKNEYAGDRMMKAAQLRFQVDSVDKRTRNIEAIVNKYGGVIADQNISNATNEINNYLTVRVPVAKFEEVIEELCREAVFMNYKKISSQDVTEEYQDIQARLRTKREVRDRYTDILKTKAKTVEDILKAEEHIRVLQEEIESREGRLQFLQTRTAMSEISLQIYQKVIFTKSPTQVEETFSAKVRDALGRGWSFVTATMLFVVSCWPFFIASFLLVVAWRRFKRTLPTDDTPETSAE